MHAHKSLSLRLAVMVAALAVFMVVGAGAALADQPDGPFGDDADEYPFLCPAVGDGVLNAPFATKELASGDQTFLPGNNQAGNHANENALNTEGPGESPGPGDGNSDWSPIWPYH